MEAVPETPEVLNLLGLIAQIKGIHQEAAGLFYRAIKADHNRAVFYFNLGISLNCWNKPHEAVEAFSRAAELDTGMKEAWLQIGNIRQELGQTNEADKAYEQALKIDPGYAEARLRQALLTPKTAAAKLQILQQQFPDEPLTRDTNLIIKIRPPEPVYALYQRRGLQTFPQSFHILCQYGIYL